ncbi:glycosyltransferase [Bifidobacterium pseudolongum]|uniref:Glycosyl transferase family 1 n=1 Tax=Bifidobacterium pseudolongum subsp. globosum TaxID=1690 RepID=A0A8B3RKE6_9BIFI|nr:glycosyltransferase [Bifidobacterium pseudolongum]RYQ45969.1 glycosyl transferase family 1 [Bifidobacterium pseudolongum subsp. globosum]
MPNKPIRVLQVVPSLNRSAGVARVVYNWHQFHDEKRVHFDYLHHSVRNGELMHDSRYDEDLQADGSQVFTVNYAADDFCRFTREMKHTIEKIGGEYDIVHCHMPNSAFLVLREAKKAGVQNRIVHSHLNSSSDKLLHRVRNYPLNTLGGMYTTNRIACSQEAGRYLFGSKPFTIINNGIALEDFVYSKIRRNDLREQLGLDASAVVIGCVGRFVKQKNFPFAIQVFSQLHKVYPATKMVILGDGVDRNEIENAVRSENIEDAVLLLGVREDMNELYSVMDVFFMPSLYEGLPVSAVEAQAAGLPCVYSTGVPKETDITGTGVFLPLDTDMRQWVETLEKAIASGRHMENSVMLETQGYSAKVNTELLMQYYEHLIGRE